MGFFTCRLIAEAGPKTVMLMYNDVPWNVEDVLLGVSQKLRPKTTVESQKLRPKTPVESQKLRPKTPSESQKLRPKTPSESQKLRPKTPSESQKLRPRFALIQNRVCFNLSLMNSLN